MRKKLLEWVIKDCLTILICSVYYLFLHLINNTCLILWVTGVKCPTCGMTRAIVSLLKGDVRLSLSLNFLAVPTSIAIYLNIHVGKRFKKFVNIYTFVVAIGVALRYIILLLGDFI